MSVCTEKCWECRYHGEVLFDELCCDYIIKKYEPRGCPAGDKCDKFEPLKNTDEE